MRVLNGRRCLPLLLNNITVRRHLLATSFTWPTLTREERSIDTVAEEMQSAPKAKLLVWLVTGCARGKVNHARGKVNHGYCTGNHGYPWRNTSVVPDKEGFIARIERRERHSSHPRLIELGPNGPQPPVCPLRTAAVLVLKNARCFRKIRHASDNEWLLC